jgi:hypothetical protein
MYSPEKSVRQTSRKKTQQIETGLILWVIGAIFSRIFTQRTNVDHLLSYRTAEHEINCVNHYMFQYNIQTTVPKYTKW